MSRLGRFMGVKKEVDIDGDIFKVYPLRVKNMDIINGLQSTNKDVKNDAMFQLFKISLRDEKDITKDEVMDMPMDVQSKILDVILDVNGLKEKVEQYAKTQLTPKS